jgi:hypothetical protein
MDFMIAKDDFDSAMRQILQGRKSTSGDVVDMTATHVTLTVVVTGRSVELPIEAATIGSASIPIGTIAGLKRITGTYKETRFRIRISEGRLRFQGYSVADPNIKMKNIAKRIIDIPEDALALDILSLTHIFSMQEIEECGLQGKLLDAQKEFGDDLDAASSTLRKYNVGRNELRILAEAKITTHAAALKHVLLDNE